MHKFGLSQENLGGFMVQPRCLGPFSTFHQSARCFLFLRWILGLLTNTFFTLSFVVHSGL